MTGATRNDLVTARKRKGHTQESLAHALGVELSTIGRWERAISDPQPSMWPRIARELGITAEELGAALESTTDDVAITLKALLRLRHSQTYPTFKRLYEKAARTIDSTLVATCPTKRQYYRWLNGQLSGLPHPGARGVLEAMFPGYTAEELFTPWMDMNDSPNEVSARPTDPPPQLAIGDPAGSVVGHYSAVALGSATDCGTANLGMSPANFLATINPETPIPSKIGWPEVNNVQAVTRAVALSENLHGGGLSCEAGVSQLRWAGQLLDVPASDEIHRALVETLGNLGSVVAFSAFDIADYQSASRCFQFALWCADQSGSWPLRANTLAEMSRMAVYLGDVDEALSLVEFAQVRADRVSATGRAMMSALRARLLAMLGRHSEAIAEVDRADEQFGNRKASEDPPWLVYYDEGEHQGTTGRALIPIACDAKRPEVAGVRLEKAIRLQGPRYPRSRTFTRTRLASLMMDLGDPHDAIPIGRQALNEAGALRSNRVISELQLLAQAAEQHTKIGDVQDLRHDIDALMKPEC